MCGGWSIQLCHNSTQSCQILHAWTFPKAAYGLNTSRESNNFADRKAIAYPCEFLSYMTTHMSIHTEVQWKILLHSIVLGELLTFHHGSGTITNLVELTNICQNPQMGQFTLFFLLFVKLFSLAVHVDPVCQSGVCKTEHAKVPLLVLTFPSLFRSPLLFSPDFY